MNVRKIVFASVAGVGLVVGAIAIAQAPTENIDPHRHPNLADAQKFIVQAYNRLDNAQELNHGDMKGHAARAKQLLIEADKEIKLAAEAANRGGR